MVIESVNNTDVDVRKELFGGVILTGAVSFEGLFITCAQAPIGCVRGIA